MISLRFSIRTGSIVCVSANIKGALSFLLLGFENPGKESSHQVSKRQLSNFSNCPQFSPVNKLFVGAFRALKVDPALSSKAPADSPAIIIYTSLSYLQLRDTTLFFSLPLSKVGESPHHIFRFVINFILSRLPLGQ